MLDFVYTNKSVYFHTHRYVKRKIVEKIPGDLGGESMKGYSKLDMKKTRGSPDLGAMERTY